MEIFRILKGHVSRAMSRLRYVLSDSFPSLYGRPSYQRYLNESSIQDIVHMDQYASLNLFSRIHYFRKDKVFLVTGFDEVEQVLQNHSDLTIVKPPGWDQHDDLLLASPSDHEKIARFIRGSIDKDILEKSNIHTQDISRRLMECIPHSDVFDFHKVYACPVAYLVTCHILGIERSDADEYESLGGGDIMLDSFYAPFEHWCERWLDRPFSDDVDPRLFHAFKRHLHNGLLDRRQVLDLLFIVFHASLKTIATLLSGLVEEMLRQGPDFIRRLQGDERALMRFIEEVNRLKPSIIRLDRLAIKDTYVSGVLIPEGSRVVVDIQYANRDPRHFEDAHDFRLDGIGHRNLSFGAGLHKCLGMVMARHVTREILDVIMPHLTGMRYVYSRWILLGEDGHFKSPEMLHLKRKVTMKSSSLFI
ncbi:MAG: cytochrome P450 [Acidobacteria bacterium]|nr:cytochrome P450 [Acidobacteriota bacterium]